MTESNLPAVEIVVDYAVIPGVTETLLTLQTPTSRNTYWLSVPLAKELVRSLQHTIGVTEEVLGFELPFYNDMVPKLDKAVAACPSTVDAVSSNIGEVAKKSYDH